VSEIAVERRVDVVAEVHRSHARVVHQFQDRSILTAEKRIGHA
jgi:hypothetical protein